MAVLAVGSDTAEGLEAAVAEAKAKIFESLGDKLSPERRAQLEREMERTMADLRRDGPKVTSIKSIIEVLKDLEKESERLPDALMSVAKLEGKSPHIFILGGICADIVTARALLAEARTRLRDHLDCACNEKPATEKG